MGERCRVYLEIGTFFGGSMIMLMQDSTETKYIGIDIFSYYGKNIDPNTGKEVNLVHTSGNIEKNNPHGHKYYLILNPKKEASMEIEKIKVNRDESISIQYSIILAEPENKPVEYLKVKIKSNREAHQAFYACLGNLKTFAVDMLEMNDKEINRISVKGVTYSVTKEGIMGAVLHVERKVNSSETPIQIDTPHFIADSYSEDKAEPNIMKGELVDLLIDFKKNAISYIEKYQDQIELNLDGDE